MTTLREILNEPRSSAEDGYAELFDAIQSWAYGQKGECPRCEGDGSGVNDPFEMIPCPTCNGSGTIREPGLVERLDAVLNDERSYGKNLPELLLAALREELGAWE